MNIPLYDFEKQGKSVLSLSDDLFVKEPNINVISQALQCIKDNEHAGLAHTKTRAEVRGGGRKPWRQKGTGRARQGSIRSPQWVGGGIVFGPRKRIITRKFPKKMRYLAVRSVLTLRAREDRLWGVFFQDLSITKSREVSATFMKGFPPARRVLFMVHGRDEGLIQAVRNVPNITLIYESFPSVLQLVQHDLVVGTKEVFERMRDVYVPPIPFVAEDRGGGKS